MMTNYDQIPHDQDNADSCWPRTHLTVRPSPEHPPELVAPGRELLDVFEDRKALGRVGVGVVLGHRGAERARQTVAHLREGGQARYRGKAGDGETQHVGRKGVRVD